MKGKARKAKYHYPKRLDNIIAAIWMTTEAIYDQENNKRKMNHKPLIRYRLFRKIEIDRFDKNQRELLCLK